MMAGVLVAGSRVRVGFAVAAANPDSSFYPDYNVIFPDIEGCLYNTGQFDFVELFLSEGGYFAKDYITVVAITALDFTQAEDFGGLVAQQIGDCAPSLIVVRRDPVKVDAVPDAAAGSSGGQQVNNQEGQTPNTPGKCDNLSFVDAIGCNLGLSAEGAGIGVAVLGIGVLVLLVVVLKR